MDHEHEGLERRRAGVDETQPEEVPMHGSGNVFSSELLSGTRIYKAQLRSTESCVQLLWCCEQLGMGIFFVFHGEIL